MITNDAERIREEYMTRLDDAMRDLPHGVAAEIRSGILEELHGLDAAATAARISQLGDPAAIAREAHAETPGIDYSFAPVAAPVAAAGPALTSSRRFATVAALTLSFGGIVIPVAGWFVGVVLVCLSTLWRTREKVVAIVVPFSFSVIVLVGGLVAFSAFGDVTSTASTGSGIETVTNPLMPATYDLVWTAVMVLGLLTVPASGLWLLWRLMKR